jgi:hypothetical protein
MLSLLERQGKAWMVARLYLAAYSEAMADHDLVRAYVRTQTPSCQFAEISVLRAIAVEWIEAQ